MTQSGIKTLPILRGPLAASGPWQALIARPNKRVYPFPLGATADTTTTGTVIQMGGLGEPFVANDYIIVCNATSFGNSTLFIPDFNKIRQIVSVSGTEDDITVDAAVNVTSGDHILNIGADGATAPKTSPDLDAIVALTDDPYGVTSNSNGYLLTGDSGHFKGFLPTSTTLIDLLITDNSKNPEIVIPFFSVGVEA